VEQEQADKLELVDDEDVEKQEQEEQEDDELSLNSEEVV